MGKDYSQMVPQLLLDCISDNIRDHCAAKGYVSGPNWNPLTPQDSVATLAMARLLVQSGRFDDYIAIASSSSHRSDSSELG
jgi:hypothetical protein